MNLPTTENMLIELAHAAHQIEKIYYDTETREICVEGTRIHRSGGQWEKATGHTLQEAIAHFYIICNLRT